MATQFQIAARALWPGYYITGDGGWAVVCTRTKIITLHTLPLLAQTEAQKQHSNWECAALHTVQPIKPAATSQWQPVGALGKD